MSVGSDGPKPIDVNSLFLQAKSSSGGSEGGGDESNDILGSSSKLLTKLTGIRWNSLFKTGLFAQFTPSQAWSEKKVNEGAQSFSSPGGSGSKFLYDKLQLASWKDLSKLTKPAVEPLSPEVMHSMHTMSMAALGNLTPSDTPSRGGRESLGVA